MLIVGGVLFISWAIWDGFFAEYPFLPKRVFNRTLVSLGQRFYSSSARRIEPELLQIACVGVDFFYFFSAYLYDAYFASWVWVVTNYNVSLAFHLGPAF